MNSKISIKLALHSNSIAKENYEVVSLSNAISVPINGGIGKHAKAGDFITESQAQGLVEDRCYEIVTTAKK